MAFGKASVTKKSLQLPRTWGRSREPRKHPVPLAAAGRPRKRSALSSIFLSPILLYRPLLVSPASSAAILLVDITRSNLYLELSGLPSPALPASNHGSARARLKGSKGEVGRQRNCVITSVLRCKRNLFENY